MQVYMETKAPRVVINFNSHEEFTKFENIMDVISFDEKACKRISKITEIGADDIMELAGEIYGNI